MILQAERYAMSKKLAAAEKSSADLESARQQASNNAEAAQQQAQKLQQEVDRLHGIVHSQSTNLTT